MTHEPTYILVLYKLTSYNKVVGELYEIIPTKYYSTFKIKGIKHISVASNKGWNVIPFF